MSEGVWKVRGWKFWANNAQINIDTDISYCKQVFLGILSNIYLNELFVSHQEHQPSWSFTYSRHRQSTAREDIY